MESWLSNRLRTKAATPYNPKISGQVKVLNWEIMNILAKIVNTNRNNLSENRDDALWEYHTAYNTPIGMSTWYQVIIGTFCHLKFEFDHKALWALKALQEVPTFKVNLKHLMFYF